MLHHGKKTAFRLSRGISRHDAERTPVAQSAQLLGYGLYDHIIEIRFPVDTRDLTLLQKSIQNGSGAPKASYPSGRKFQTIAKFVTVDLYTLYAKRLQEFSHI
jgi:hypothetical protein